MSHKIFIDTLQKNGVIEVPPFEVMLNKQKVQKFRGDFEKAVAQLEKDYGVHISLGTIRFDSNELRAKMTAKVGDAPIKSTREDFNVGDVVKINHKKSLSKI